MLAIVGTNSAQLIHWESSTLDDEEKGNKTMKKIAQIESARVIRMLYLAMTLLAFTMVLGGCRTAHGFGEDMERAGEKIQEKAH